MNQLSRLQNWYAAQCNGDWEHAYGVLIETLDNPGWKVEVDLAETEFDGRAFEPVHYGLFEQAETSGDEWIHCQVKDSKFVGVGGPLKLDEIVDVFLRWVNA